MKRLLPVMIAAVMICVAFAAVDADVDAKSDPHLWVGKTAVTDDVDLPTWTYDKGTNTITFKNYVQTGDDVHEYGLSMSAAIYYNGDKDLKIVIKGTNKIDPTAVNGIMLEGNGGLEISGNGKLTVSNSSYHSAISSDYGLTINGGELNLVSKHSPEYDLSTIYTAFEPFEMNKGTVICSEMIHSNGAAIKGGCIVFSNMAAEDRVFFSPFYGGIEIEGDPYTDNFVYGSTECKAEHDGDVCISYTGGKIVTFDANGGSCSPSSKTTDAWGNIDSLPEATRDGYLFAGWYTEKEGGERVKTTHFDKDTTVYAQWVNTHFIIFDAQGGVSEVPFEVTDLEGELRTIPEATRDGWRFGGWYTQPDGSGERITKSTVFHDNATVYAFWVNTHVVCFNAQGGDAQVPFEVTDLEGKLRMIPTAERDGYTFEGWYTEPNGGEKITADTVFHTDATIYAHWTKDMGPLISVVVLGVTCLLVFFVVVVLFYRRR